ncbi:hypothetical protein ACE38W_09920 [Chitinophaga sp. Hz27]|uniref:hypothetical protein n=1 Tax=Chitinophaga sp. Hz27 TaxID=3347169 RepID=UPI0035DD5D34
MKRKSKPTKEKIWMELLINVMDNPQVPVSSPFAENGLIESIFFYYENKKDLVQGIIWCSVTHQAIHVGKLPANSMVHEVHSDYDTIKKRIPPLQIVMMVN